MKYGLGLKTAETKKRWENGQTYEVDMEELPMRIGEHIIFQFVEQTAQGAKRVTVTAKVEKII